MTRDELVRLCRHHLRPCMWHGTKYEGTFGRRPTGFCAQCQRRDDPMVISARELLEALGEEP